MARSNGIAVLYTNVTEELGVSGGMGKTTYEYNTFPDAIVGPGNPSGFTLASDFLNEVVSMSHFRGLLKRRAVYNESEELVQQEVNVYNYDYQHVSDVFNYTQSGTDRMLRSLSVKEIFPQADCDAPGEPLPGQLPLDDEFLPAMYGYVYYDVSSAWIQLEETKSTSYFGSDSIQVVTSYTYGNKTHQQVTEQNMTDSKGDVWVTESHFPDDVSGASSLPGGDITTDELTAVNKMKDAVNHQVASVLQTEQKKNDTLVSRTRNNFKYWNASFVSPESIETSLGLNALEPRVRFHSYDSLGNPLEVSKEGGSRISYLWGYQGTVPIMQGLNITSSNLEAAASWAVTNMASKPSGVDDLKDLLGNVGDITTASQKTAWRNFLVKLYQHPDIIGKAQVTSMTYKLGIGMTSQTGPNGLTVYYEYDSSGRLEYVRDKDGNILKKNEYAYKVNANTTNN